MLVAATSRTSSATLDACSFFEIHPRCFSTIFGRMLLRAARALFVGSAKISSGASVSRGDSFGAVCGLNLPIRRHPDDPPVYFPYSIVGFQQSRRGILRKGVRQESTSCVCGLPQLIKHRRNSRRSDSVKGKKHHAARSVLTSARSREREELQSLLVHQPRCSLRFTGTPEAR